MYPFIYPSVHPSTHSLTYLSSIFCDQTCWEPTYFPILYTSTELINIKGPGRTKNSPKPTYFCLTHQLPDFEHTFPSQNTLWQRCPWAPLWEALSYALAGRLFLTRPSPGSSTALLSSWSSKSHHKLSTY